MAAPTITRTAWTDDDGSGTTGTVLNNAVKTELYGQIDTLAASLFGTASTAWTPADNSGATLVFTSVTANYGKVGNLLFAMLDLTYPSTANGSQANISGLPVASVASAVFVCGFSSFATAFTAYIAAGATSIQLYGIGGGAIANSSVSLKRIQLAGVYLIG